MEFDSSFEVPLPPAEAWKVLMDIQGIAPCLPGAELTDVVDERTYKGKVSVRLGPVALTFAGEAKFEDIDDANHKARVKAQGRDNKGRGGASATVDFHLEPAASGTKVMVHTDLSLSGSVAQYGRGAGMIQDLASTLIGQFAKSLKAQLAASQPIDVVAAPVAAPVTVTAEGGTVQAQVPPVVAPVIAPVRPRMMPPATPAKPISGFSLMFRVLWNSFLRTIGLKRAS